MTFGELKVGEKFRSTSATMMIKTLETKDKWENVINAIAIDGKFAGWLYGIMDWSLVFPEQKEKPTITRLIDLEKGELFRIPALSAITKTAIFMVTDEPCEYVKHNQPHRGRTFKGKAEMEVVREKDQGK